MKILQGQRRIKTVIIISLVNVVIILVYGFISWKSWENIQYVTKNTTEKRTSVFSKLQKDKISIEKLREYSVNLKSGVNDCSAVFLVSWQENVNDKFKKYKTDCQESMEATQSIAYNIDKIIDFMKFDKELSDEIDTLSDKLAKYQPNDFTSIEKGWSGVKNKIEAGKNEAKLRKLAAERIDAILLSVRDLKLAEEKKDSGQFTIAKDKMTVAINSLVGMQNELTQEVQSRLDNLLKDF